MTIWQILSLPFWVSAAVFLIGAISLLCGAGREPKETFGDILNQFAIVFVFVLALLIVAKWMWG